MPWIASARGSSRKAMRPTALPCESTTETLLPCASSLLAWPNTSISLTPSRDAAPMVTIRLSTLALRPFPGSASEWLAGEKAMPRSLAWATMATASGCDETASAAAARRSTSVASLSANGTISVTFGLPSVSVPVLSKAMACTLPIASSTPPPLTRRPRRAPAASAEAIAAGVEMTRAQGHPIRTASRRGRSMSTSRLP